MGSAFRAPPRPDALRNATEPSWTDGDHEKCSRRIVSRPRRIRLTGSLKIPGLQCRAADERDTEGPSRVNPSSTAAGSACSSTASCTSTGRSWLPDILFHWSRSPSRREVSPVTAALTAQYPAAARASNATPVTAAKARRMGLPLRSTSNDSPAPIPADTLRSVPDRFPACRDVYIGHPTVDCSPGDSSNARTRQSLEAAGAQPVEIGCQVSRGCDPGRSAAATLRSVVLPRPWSC